VISVLSCKRTLCSIHDPSQDAVDRATPKNDSKRNDGAIGPNLTFGTVAYKVSVNFKQLTERPLIDAATTVPDGYHWAKADEARGGQTLRRAC